ncbi:hypothetical protein HDU93_006760, partial [Gonapodya sp. JEL0774]
SLKGIRGVTCDSIASADNNNQCTSPNPAQLIPDSRFIDYQMDLKYQGQASETIYNTYLSMLQAKAASLSGPPQSYDIIIKDPDGNTPTYTEYLWKSSVYLYVKVGPFLDRKQAEANQNKFGASM